MPPDPKRFGEEDRVPALTRAIGNRPQDKARAAARLFTARDQVLSVLDALPNRANREQVKASINEGLRNMLDDLKAGLG